MRVELAAEVFETDKHVEDVLALLRHFARRRHEWIVASTELRAIVGYCERNTPPRLRLTYHELARKSAVRGTAYAAAVPVTVPQVRVSAETIADQLADLERPAVLVVENDDSDGTFIRAVATVLGAADILQAIDKDWLAIAHGGGGDTYRRARDEHDAFRRIKRAAVLLDSDRLVPDAPAKNAHRIEELRAHGLRVHVLTLREAENYLPNRALRAVRPHREASQRLRCLKRLTLDQRGYFDMKHGFRKTGGVPEQQRDLFADVPRETVAGLGEGFGRDVLRILETTADGLTVDDFARDVGETVPDELRGLLAMLRAIL